MLVLNLIGIVFFIGAITCTDSASAHQQQGPDPCGDHNVCWTRYRPINHIMENPEFDRMLNNNSKLNLNCSDTEVRAAGSCDPDDVNECASRIPRNSLLISWKHFCGNKTVIEARPDCWSSLEISPILSACINAAKNDRRMETVPGCVGEHVTAVPVCGASIGDLFEGLLWKMYNDYLQRKG